MDSGDDIVSDTHIGDGVYLQDLVVNDKVEELFQQVKSQNPEDYKRLLCRQSLEVTALRYTHRFYISFDAVSSSHRDKVRHARELIMRAIVLSRIVKPLPIPSHPTTILTTDGESQLEIQIGFYGTAYVVRRPFQETITHADIDLIAKLWPASQYFYDNRRQYQRLFRALITYNDAYHIPLSHVRHVVLHSALETLICASHRNNKNQVVYRLPQLVDEITQEQATEIYDLCADVKHTAAPALLDSENSRELDKRNSKRYEATRCLDESLRKLFIRALDDRSFARELEDKSILETKYHVPGK